mgnify:CR=1 FL=1
MTTTPRSKKPARAVPPPLPPAVDIEAIAARVTEVTNNIMSKVIQQRDNIIVGQQDAERKLQQAQANVARIESDLRDAERNIMGLGAKMEKRQAKVYGLFSELEHKLAGYKDSDEAKVLALIGQEVTIVGGNQKMVAAGLNEDGEMTCVYEQRDGSIVNVVSASVPPLALRLVNPAKAEPKPASPARKSIPAKRFKKPA